MRYRLFGTTGLRVSELLLGTMAFDDADQARRLIGAYADAGGNVLDTASAYGEGEALLGSVVADRDRFVIATKYTLTRDATDPNGGGNHRKNLMLSLERSLRRLRTDYVDILWVHVWDRHTPVEETMRALDDAVRAGKVLYIGISDSPAWLTARANTLAEWRGWTPFAGLQVPYSLLNRDAERELLPMADALGLSVAAWAPLAAGKLAGGTRRSDPGSLTGRERAAADAVRAVADELGATPAQVAVAWTRRRSRSVLPLVGARDVDQLTDVLRSVDLTLPEDAVARLEAAVEFRLGFPADFIAECEPSPFVFGDAATRVDGR
ncbi:aldo/keto reductase [Actinokineospora sp. UTMC 2448]|uniref:aldo/keto reductase n=1 Tax=Actinokineospora sp. UTMC 2448 TaxID=2268449 RepID=UPI002164DCB5|nr:aldo/keto reductase [Actinokineospora sp. UTMC 2448]UVS80321.1 L-glyceraldehyde 3-phosphate reductase [Actinokineospora sp. UTMC 2448]